jgi:hypothetical protein
MRDGERRGAHAGAANAGGGERHETGTAREAPDFSKRKHVGSPSMIGGLAACSAHAAALWFSGPALDVLLLNNRAS